MNGPDDRLRGLVARARSWLAPRWDGPDKVDAFLCKPLPPNVSWLHTLGSLLLFYIGFQILTGILLGFYYSAGPDLAYQSMQYIRNELFLGRFLHNLHRYGSGFVIVTAFLHMVRSYFLASYKAPRELLWISGVMLFILLTLFAFTGQLLPYDQRGYWATVVGIRIASSAPGLGEAVHALLTGGYGDIGATTLSRFYVLHIAVLPLMVLGLIGIHLGILQRTGSAGPISPGAAATPTRPFFPGQAAKDVLVAALGALALGVVAAVVQARETGPADPAAGSFVPRPEWYFLSHYVILKILPGRWLIVGTFILPNIVLGGLMLLPLIDRKPHRAWRDRKLAVAAGALFVVGIVGLTAVGVIEARAEVRDSESTVVEGLSQDPVERGRAYFVGDNSCRTCHEVNGAGGTQGPDLTHVAGRLRAEYLPRWVRNPRSFKPETEMPAFEGTDDQLNDVIQYLLTLQ